MEPDFMLELIIELIEVCMAPLAMVDDIMSLDIIVSDIIESDIIVSDIISLDIIVSIMESDNIVAVISAAEDIVDIVTVEALVFVVDWAAARALRVQTITVIKCILDFDFE